MHDFFCYYRCSNLEKQQVSVPFDCCLDAGSCCIFSVGSSPSVGAALKIAAIIPATTVCPALSICRVNTEFSKNHSSIWTFQYQYSLF